ncbi:MAG: hypothetical protein UT84_C0001G0013 [Candidatus Curtissbacteria bacterium GW2011_GWA1_40_16]|uniref:Uncharacterized protein n=1 Tax=Candidatus Curtissbacteria bacterium GW2011_GWA1_40_16 TaxID=1618405 RepID=A0A0G0RFU6_9BACT|nr:MAG: hypothetical protein UT84_C0001G0013 [Candidatus Curtissbacteria bacterium GW2011_GWA1_40_16]
MNSQNPSTQDVEESLKKNLFLVKTALDWVVEYAIDKGTKSEIFVFVPKIWQDDAFLITKGKGQENAQVSASPKTAKVFIPITQIDNLHDILHESIHRLAILQMELSTNKLFFQIAKAFDLDLVLKNKNDINPTSFDIVLQSPGDYQIAKNHLVEVYQRFLEGITEWVTQFTNTLSREHGYALFEDLSAKYSTEVLVIEKMKSTLISKGYSQDHTNAMLIQTGLTCDAEILKEKLKGDFLKYLNDL